MSSLLWDNYEEARRRISQLEAEVRELKSQTAAMLEKAAGKITDDMLSAWWNNCQMPGASSFGQIIRNAILALIPTDYAAALAERVQQAVQEAVLGPFVFAIETSGGDWKDGEQCVFGDQASCQDEVDTLNDELPEEYWYRVVPLYSLAAHHAAAGAPIPKDAQGPSQDKQ